MYAFKTVQIRVDGASKLQHFHRCFPMQIGKGPSCYLQDSMGREAITSSYLSRTQALLGIFCGSSGAGGHGNPSHVPLHF